MAILEPDHPDRKASMRVTVLSGGVGGARLARGLATELGNRLTVVTNVGDDDVVYGLHVSPDVDTVMYTLAGIEGPHGWGRAGDTFAVMGQLARFGVDTTFRIGDEDLATNIFRTEQLDRGVPLSSVTDHLRRSLGIAPAIIPASDDPVRTKVRTADGEWLDFQDYFVYRRHQDTVADLRFDGADAAKPAPGVVDAIVDADLVVIGPSNPPLSIWPILAVPGLADAVERANRVVAVSPLFRGRALKGPADRVMASLGLPAGSAGVMAAYDGLVDELVVDVGDEDEPLTGPLVHRADTRLTSRERSEAFARWLLAL